MKYRFNHIKKFFGEPRIPYGLFVMGLVSMAAITYAAIEFGNYLHTEEISLHYAIGDVIGVQGVDLAVTGFRIDTKGNDVVKPMDGSMFLIPKIAITNLTNANLQLIPLLYFYIKDKEGDVYHITAAPLDTDQLTGPILPGETVREEIGFEVPANIDHPALYFERGVADHPVVAIDLVER